MRRTTPMILGLVATIALFGLALAMPVAAERGSLPGWSKTDTANQVTGDQARSAAERWLAQYGYGDLVVADLVTLGDTTYVVVTDAAGNGAFDLLVSRDRSSVRPAPTMMWNTSYDLITTMMAGMMNGGMSSGMMNGDRQPGQPSSMNGGMMGAGMTGMTGMMGAGTTGMMNSSACQAMMGAGATEPLAEPLTADAAAAAAQAWVDANRAGSTTTNMTSFPGYVTLRVNDGETTTGLIAVQLTTGAVWPID